MIFTLFVLFIVAATVILALGFWQKSFTVVVLGAVIFMALGGLLMSEGLDVISGVDLSTGNYSYQNYSYSSDSTVTLLASLFFYGSFIPLILSFGLLVSDEKKGGSLVGS